MNVHIDIIALAASILTIGGALAVLIIWVGKIVRVAEIWKSVECRKEENAMIIEGLFASLDGLIQLGANGNVTDGREKLQAYIIKNRK